MYLNVIKVLLDAMKSTVVQNIVAAILGDVADSALHPQIKASAETAAANTDPAHAASAVVNAVVPGLTTWSAAELAAAENEWASAQPTGSVTPQAAFGAGVSWAIAHQTTALTNGIAKAVEAVLPSTSQPMPIAATVAVDVAQLAGSVATGNDVGAITEGVADVVQGVEAVAAAHAAEGTSEPKGDAPEVQAQAPKPAAG